MSNGRYELLIKWPSGQSTLSGEITDQQYGEICRVLSPDRRAELAAIKAERDTFKAECVNLNNILDQIRTERDALRAQVAELEHQLETLRVEACKNDGK